MRNHETWQMKTVRLTLLSFEQRIDDIQRLIPEDAAMSEDDVNEARRLYKSLKADMKEIADCLSASDDGNGVSAIEAQFLIPAVHEAYCRLLAPTNSHPKKSNWGTELYSARVDLSHIRHQLDEQLGKQVASHR